MPDVYLDVCCLNRPYDDQSQDRVRLEAEAILLIMRRVDSGEWQLTTSEAVRFEVGRIADSERKTSIENFLRLATRVIIAGQVEYGRMQQLQHLGFRPLDALHIACAERAGVDVFLTTDDRLSNLAKRVSGQLYVRVANPLIWLAEETRA